MVALTSWGPLSIAVAALFAGPVLRRLGEGARHGHGAVDLVARAFVVVLTLFELLPHAVEHGGVGAVLGALVGAGGAWALSRLGTGGARAWALLALGLLSAHAAVDGAALGLADAHGGSGLAVAIALHRLPVGLAVDEVVARQGGHGRATTWAVLGLLAVATVAGSLLGHGLHEAVPETGRAAMEGMVAGALLQAGIGGHGGGRPQPGSGPQERDGKMPSSAMHQVSTR